MKKILVIDDKQDNLISIKALLKNYLPNCEVITAISGVEGINLAGKEQPDTILLDIIMPQMDGYEVCRKLKADETTKYIPIIMLTAIKTDSKSRIKGLEDGADAFLSKPIDPPELTAQIKAMLRIKAAEDKLREEKENLEIKILQRTKKLRESEEFVKEMIASSSDCIKVLDLDGKLLSMNEPGKIMLEIDDISQYLNMSWIDFWNGKDKEIALKAIDNAKINGKGVFTGWTPTVQTKTLKCWENTITAIKNSEGKLSKLLANSRDITERKQAERALRESEQKRCRAMELACAGTWEWEIKTNQVIWSNEIYRIFDVEIGTPITYETVKERVHPDDREYHDKHTASWLKNQGGAPYEYRIVHTDESIHYILAVGEVICDAMGEPERMLGFAQDITERKKAEKELLTKEREFRTLTENLPGIVFRVFSKEDNRMDFYNNVLQEITGYNPDELIKGKICSISKYIHPADKDYVEESVIQAISDKIPFDLEYRFIHKNGEIRYFSEIGKLIFDSDDTLLYLEGIIFDITERKQAEEALINKQKFLDAVIDQSPYPTWVSNPEGTMIRANPALKNVLNLTDEQLIGKYNVFQDVQIEPKLKQLIRDTLEKGSVSDYELDWAGADSSFDEIKDSSRVYCEGTIFPIIDQEGAITNAIITYKDVSERKQAEQKLIESEEKFRSIFENKGTATGLFGEDGIIWNCNSEFVEMIGFEKAEIINSMKWSDFVVKEDLERLQQYNAARMKKGNPPPSNYECGIISKHGKIVDVIVNISMMGTMRIVSLTNITERKQAEKALKQRMTELEIFNEAAVGRELKINDLRKEVNEILEMMGKEKKYEVIT